MSWVIKLLKHVAYYISKSESPFLTSVSMFKCVKVILENKMVLVRPQVKDR